MTARNVLTLNNFVNFYVQFSKRAQGRSHEDILCAFIAWTRFDRSKFDTIAMNDGWYQYLPTGETDYLEDWMCHYLGMSDDEITEPIVVEGHLVTTAIVRY